MFSDRRSLEPQNPRRKRSGFSRKLHAEEREKAAAGRCRKGCVISRSNRLSESCGSEDAFQRMRGLVPEAVAQLALNFWAFFVRTIAFGDKSPPTDLLQLARQ